MRTNDNSGASRGAGGQTGSEDNTQAVRNMQEVQDNTRANAESARRVEASVPAAVRDTPIQASGVGTAGQGSEDTAEASRRQQEVHDSARASAEQARRVAASVSPEVANTPIQASGVGAPGQGGEDNTQAVRNMQAVQDNTRANAEASRRIEATTPPELRSDSPNRS